MTRFSGLFKRSGLSLNQEAGQIVRDMISDSGPSRNSTIDTEYLLLAILKNKDSKVCETVTRLGLNYDQARPMILKRICNCPSFIERMNTRVGMI